MRNQNHSRLSRMLRLTQILGMSALIAMTLGTIAQAEPIATLRGAEINQEPTPPMMSRQDNSDMRRMRNYPEQPPTIPHKIRGYLINLNANKCLSCHSRRATADSQAPMVSVTHFMDRDNQVLATVTPRRYFCTQCHVPQLQTKPLVGNDFVDADTLIKAKGN